MKIVLKAILCFMLFFVVVVLTRALWPAGPGTLCPQAHKMARLNTYINHQRRMGVDEPFNVLRANFVTSGGLLPRQLTSIEYAEVPEELRVGNLKGVDYYLFDKNLNLGMFCNGVIFTLPFDVQVLEESRMDQDPCS